jgi:glycosyltransferase involved in cell wall biosynthesis
MSEAPRLGLVLDQVIHEHAGTYSTDEAFSLFVQELATRYFDRIEFCSRVKAAGAAAPYRLDPQLYDVLRLPWYRDVVELCVRSPRLMPEIGRALASVMDRWEMMIIGGIHPIAPLALRMARRRGIPSLLWIRGSYYGVLSHRIGGNLVRRGVGLAAAAVVLRAIPSGTAIVSSGRADYRFLSRMGPTHLVYTSKFERGDFAPAPRPPKAPEQAPRILYVGRIAPEKGLEVLLEAFEQLAGSWNGPMPSLSLAGFDFHGSRYAEEFGQRLATSPFASRISMLGLVPYGQKLFDLYDAHDVLVLSSHTEGFPQVLLEGMARGLPIVSTAVGGIPAVIQDGVNGLLVPARNPPALAGALTRVLVEPDLAARLSAEGSRSALGFTRSAQIEALVRFCDGAFPDAPFVRRRGLVAEGQKP